MRNKFKEDNNNVEISKFRREEDLSYKVRKKDKRKE
jgi:hypothetical protein